MAVSKKSLENLTNIGEMGFTKEQIKENGKKGGKASGKARRERKEMKELILDILDMNIKDGKAETFSNIADSKGKNITVNQSIILAQVHKAMAGDTKAIEFLRDTAGMKPINKQEIEAKVFNDGKLGDILDLLTEENSETAEK
jgi:hypothetical protein